MLLGLLVFLPIFAAPVVYFGFRGQPRTRDNALALLTGAEVLLSLALALGSDTLVISGVLTDGLRFTSGGFRTVYSLITSLLWLGTTLFAREYFRHESGEGMDGYWFFLLTTLGATQGVMLSADFLTTFVFFELVSLCSFPWVIHEQTREAVRAGYTYLFIAIGGGLVLFFGLAMLWHSAGTLEYAALREAVGAARAAGSPYLLPAGLCILLGFGAKAGMFPLHVWLPMAHPVAPSPASALLSGILTKVGVFGVLMVSGEVLWDDAAFGWTVLVLALVTMALGAVLALFSVNLKRTLACSSMSQIGFILTGVAVTVLARAYGGTEAAELAASGTVLHMANHSLLKLVLFLAAGAVLMNLHALTLDDIRGWGRNKPVLNLCFALAGLGISGVPLLNGYISKTLLHEGLVHLTAAVPPDLSGLLHGAEWVFLCSGGLTFAYMLKLYLCLFVEQNADPARQAAYDADARCMDRLSSGVLLCGALALVPMGQPAFMVWLAGVMTGEPLGHFSAFAWENLKGGGISLAIGGAVYLLFVRPVLRSGGRYVNRWPSALDLEGGLYRPLFTRWLPSAFGAAAGVLGENRILRPLCRYLVLAGALLARVLGDSLDAVVVLLRRTVVREVRPRDGQVPMRVSGFHAFEKASEEALNPLMENFSFALLMTCVGVILFLGMLVFLLNG